MGLRYLRPPRSTPTPKVLRDSNSLGGLSANLLFQSPGLYLSELAAFWQLPLEPSLLIIFSVKHSGSSLV